jgi:hypothetical protein
MGSINPQGGTRGGGANIVGGGVGEGPGPDIMAAATHSYYNRQPYWSATQQGLEDDLSTGPGEH